jgi:quercetin dioxygenase-like cupin family protein
VETVSQSFGGALSKPQVMPDTAGARHIDYRISMYQPMAYVEKHSHKVQEQVYHVLDGEGLMEIDGNPTWFASTTAFFSHLASHIRSRVAAHRPGFFLAVTSPVTDDGAAA